MKSLSNLLALAAISAIAVFTDEAKAHEEECLPQASEEEERPAQCIGIALSNASDYGPYQAGALVGLLKHQKLTGERYHVSTGVALGALNAYALATHKDEEISETIEFLRKCLPPHSLSLSLDWIECLMCSDRFWRSFRRLLG